MPFALYLCSTNNNSIMRHLITYLLFWASIFPSMSQSSLTYGFDHPQDSARNHGDGSPDYFRNY